MSKPSLLPARRKTNRLQRKLQRCGFAAVLALAGLCRFPAAQEAEPAAARFGDMLHLANGDKLVGRILAASPETGVVWQYTTNTPAANFNYSAVREIELALLWQPRKQGGNRSVIRLSNGDELAGQLREVSANEAVFETWYGGALRFPRDRWQWIVFDDESETPLFSGPAGLEGWTRGDVSMALMQGGYWTYHNQAFYATKAASIARDLALPDRARLQFDLHWKGLLNLAFALYTDYLQPVNLTEKDSEPAFGGFYSMRLSSHFVEVVTVKQNVPLHYLERVQTRAFSEKRKAHIDIRVDKATANIALLVDGQLVKQWTDKKGFVGEGAGIRLVHQGQGAIRFSNFRVTAWNGRIEEPPAVRAAAQEDQITLRNGDRQIGKVQSIQNGAIILSAANGTTEIPLQAVKKIEFAGVADQKTAPPADNRTIAGNLADQGTIRLKLSELRDGRLRGTNSNFGPFDFQLRAFERLSFGKP